MTRRHVAEMAEVALKGVARTNVKRETRERLAKARAGALHSRQADLALVHTRALWRWALSEGLVESDPTAGIKRRHKTTTKERALSDAEIATLWRSLLWVYSPERRFDARRVMICIYLLTGCRRDEVREMRLTELDLEADPPRWTLPPSRVKNKRQHVIPLSALAVDLLNAAIDKARKSSPETEFVFPSDRDGTKRGSEDRPYNATALSAPIRRAIDKGHLALEPLTLHDLRRTTATTMARTGIDERIIEHCLNHAPPGGRSITGSIYNRHDFLPEKREAFEKLAAHIETLIAGAAEGKAAA